MLKCAILKYQNYYQIFENLIEGFVRKKKWRRYNEDAKEAGDARFGRNDDDGIQSDC